ncbi:hypothetical protein [Roseicyclus persicicus]|uniref:Uncharacterized protein n=1 Tax=Roseicyclus persicicus TaxID=2650661 RepID=A0A7X6GZB4_9RHOB|nr:hypothetical protein [Roseibacterium persicicum]NKX44006.1 hypothetical protein [Roseibacterium persicicum]
MKMSFSSFLRLLVSAIPLIGASTATSALPIRPAEHQSSQWMQTRTTDTAEAYTRFILENPDSPMVAEARARLATLARVEAAVTARLQPAVDRALESPQQDAATGGFGRIMNI